jgi:hypothetical protein
MSACSDWAVFSTSPKDSTNDQVDSTISGKIVLPSLLGEVMVLDEQVPEAPVMDS